jgi:hypothetical protein
MTDENRDFDITELQRPQIFFDRNRNLFRSYEAFRKQLQRRQSNGLAAAGAVFDTRLGVMLHSGNYRDWLMRPRQCRIGYRSEGRAVHG